MERGRSKMRRRLRTSGTTHMVRDDKLMSVESHLPAFGCTAESTGQRIVFEAMIDTFCMLGDTVVETELSGLAISCLVFGL